MFCVWKMERMQCVKRNLPYVVCGWKMESVVHDTLIEHGVGVTCYMLCVWMIERCSML